MHDEPNQHSGREGTAPDSPLAGLRESYAALQRVAPARYVDVWPDGKLVAKLGRVSEVAAARRIVRIFTALMVGDAIEFDDDDLADIIISATVSLHTRNADGTYEALMADGQPLNFDQRFGATIGVPEILTPVDAVFVAFSSPSVPGGPPELDALRLMACANGIATQLGQGLVEARVTAEAAVGEASAPRS